MFVRPDARAEGKRAARGNGAVVDHDARPGWPAVALGLLCVLLLGIGIPYCDLVMQGTWVGLTAFPISSLFLLVVLVVLNGVVRALGGPHLPPPAGGGGRAEGAGEAAVGARFTAPESASGRHEWRPYRTARRPSGGLPTGSLLLIYAMMLVAAGIPSFGLTGLLIPYIAGPFYFASAENHYADTLLPYLPTWLHPRSQAAMTQLYEGVRPGEPIPWSQWIGPLFYWTLLAAGVYLAFFGLSAILRRRWVDEEKLVFPLVQLPLGLAQYETDTFRAFPALLRNRTMWCFFAMPFALHTLNGLHYHYPLIPAVNVHLFSLDTYLKGKPWTALSPLWVRFLFSIIALAYLLPQELSFSLWVFFFYFLIQQVIGEALGRPMPAVQAYPVRAFVAHQMIGGILVYGVGNVLTARLHLRRVWQEAWGWVGGVGSHQSAVGRNGSRAGGAGEGVCRAGSLSPAPPEGRGTETAPYSGPEGARDGTRALQQEPMPYGLAVALVVVGFVLICGWGGAAGATVWLTGLLFALFFVVHLVAVRLVCDGGMLYVQHPFRPVNMLLAAVGSRALGPQRLAILVLFDHLFMLDNRSPLMPQIMQGHKLGELGGLSQPRLTGLMALSVVVAVVSSYVSYLRLMYRYGGLMLHQWFTTYYAKNLYCTWTSHLITGGEPATPLAFVTMALGGLSMAGLMTMHRTFLWWPLHPIGYLMGASWPMINFWFPVLLGWVAKTTILWLGGAKLYRRLIPAFLGFILAELGSAGLWVLIDFAAGVRGHAIFSF